MSISQDDFPLAKYSSADDWTITRSRDGCAKANAVAMPDAERVAYHTELLAGREVPAFVHTHEEFSAPVTKPLLIECDDCGGAGRVTLDHPNDPWARTWACSMCDGTGEVIAGCDCCREDAVEVLDGEYLCEQHFAEAMADKLLESAR